MPRPASTPQTVAARPTAKPGSNDINQGRREQDWRKGTLLIVAFTALPILLVTLLKAFMG